jgi:hypothetical protein
MKAILCTKTSLDERIAHVLMWLFEIEPLISLRSFAQWLTINSLYLVVIEMKVNVFLNAFISLRVSCMNSSTSRVEFVLKPLLQTHARIGEVFFFATHFYCLKASTCVVCWCLYIIAVIDWLVHFCHVAVDANKRCRTLRDQVMQDCSYNPAAVFKLMLHTAQFEFQLKEVWIGSIFCLFAID